jgi:hypothetical protein
MTRPTRYRKNTVTSSTMRSPALRLIAAFSPLFVVTAASAWLGGCDGCRSEPTLTEAERTRLLASAIAAPPPPPSASAAAVKPDTIGHPVNAIPGQGPPRIESKAPRIGPAFPILPGQGIGPLRFGANRQTIERLMGGPCTDVSETSCRYVDKAVELKLDGGVVTEMRVSRKGREAKRGPDGSIIEYGFFNGAILPDLYFGMQPQALQEHLGAPQKVEKITPLGADGFAERHIYDGMTLEYDAWSNGKLVLGAVVLTKSETAAQATEKALQARRKAAVEAAKRKPKVRPTTEPK